MKTLCQIIITGSLFYPVYSLADTLEQINQERQRSCQTFLSSLNHIQSCSEKVNTLSNHVLDTEQNLFQKKEFYSQVHTEEDFKKSIEWRKQDLTDARNLKGAVLSLVRQCPFFSSKIILDRLDTAIRSLRDDLHSLGYDQSWIETNKEIKQTVYDKHKLGDCDLALYKPSLDVITWHYKTEEAYLEEDMFIVQKGVSNLTVLSDYISTTAKVCGLEEAKQRVNNKAINATQKEIIQAEIKSIQYSIDESQKALISAKAKLDNLDFEEASAKMCKKLEEQEKDPMGICENPLDNPSWYYSASYFLNQTGEE